MPHPFKLHTKLAQNAAANPHDVLAAKAFLQQRGLYDAPEWGLTQFPDTALFKALRAFQKTEGLRVDGVMKIDGETEDAMRAASAMQARIAENRTDAERIQSLGRNGDTLLAHITPIEAMILKERGGAGTVNPETGLLEFSFGRIGGSKASRAARDKEANREASATRAASGSQRSGDWDSDSGRTLGYNDFNPGGKHGNKDRNGNALTGVALAVHQRALAKQAAKEKHDEEQR